MPATMKAPKGMCINHRTWTQPKEEAVPVEPTRPEIGDVVKLPAKAPQSYTVVSPDGLVLVSFRRYTFNRDMVTVTVKRAGEWQRLPMTIQEATAHYFGLVKAGYVKW